MNSIPLTSVNSSHRREVKLIDQILDRLRNVYPDAQCELKYENPFQLLIATILSTQSTEAKVNVVTPTLFDQFSTPSDFAEAHRVQIEQIIRPVGFYRQKAKFVQETSRILVDLHDGHVPSDLATLIQLPGVARKTANTVLAEVYEIAEGISVDTHVHRVSNRLGLSKGKNATKVENDLMKISDQDDWIELSHLFMEHGQKVCHVRRPNCRACALKDLCPSAQNLPEA